MKIQIFNKMIHLYYHEHFSKKKNYFSHQLRNVILTLSTMSTVCKPNLNISKIHCLKLKPQIHASLNLVFVIVEFTQD